MKYKAVIFDLDGVIFHSDKCHYLSWKEIADEVGICFNQEINNRLRGVGRTESLEIILEPQGERFSEDEKLRLAEKKNRLYRRYLEDVCPEDLSQEVIDTIELIKASGLKTAIGSSSKNAKLILKQLGLENYFDAISDGTNIVHSKPDPEVFLKAGEYIGVDPLDCLVVEDAKSGVEAAIAANMDCAAIGDAVNYNLAKYNLKSFSDLLGILGIA